MLNQHLTNLTKCSLTLTTDLDGRDLQSGPGTKIKWFCRSLLMMQRINGTNTSPNHALGMNTSGSSNWNLNQTSNKAVDGDLTTDWQASLEEGFHNSWLTVDFGANITFNKVKIFEYNQRTKGYRIEYWNGMSWITAYTGSTISSDGVTFLAVTGSQIRVVFTSGTEVAPIVYELEVYNTTPANI